MIRIGKCGISGGDVCAEEGWISVIPQTPKCIKCGAVVDNGEKPLPMKQGSSDFWEWEERRGNENG